MTHFEGANRPQLQLENKLAAIRLESSSGLVFNHFISSRLFHIAEANPGALPLGS
jgi:hypothetical protein